MNERTLPMDCAQFEEILHDLDRAGTEGFALRGIALAHAETCGSCARRMTEVEALDFSLRALAGQESDQQAPSRVEAALIAEFRRKKAEVLRARVRWQMAALGAAAALLLALGLSMRHGAKLDSRGTQTAVLSSGSTSKSGVGGVSADARQTQAVDVSLNDSEYATAFVPLPYADDPTAADGGTVVRVVLSRSALASMGLPVTDMEEAGRIPADIVLSEDGAPQAIRLVSQSKVD